MNASVATRLLRSGLAALLFASIGLQANAQSGDDKYQPQVGQSGKPDGRERRRQRRGLGTHQ